MTSQATNGHLFLCVNPVLIWLLVKHVERKKERDPSWPLRKRFFAGPFKSERKKIEAMIK